MGAIDGKLHPSAELRCAIENFNNKLQEVLRRHHAAVENFNKDYHRWLQRRMAVIDALISLQRTTDEHHHNVNIASITGASVSLVSGAACVAGLALAPFTGGLSIALSAGGLLGTTAGSLTTVGARIVDFGLSKEAVDKALVLVDEDCQETMHLSHLIEVCAKHEEEAERLVMNDILLKMRQNEGMFTELLTTPLLKERYQRIKKGTATVDDVLIILSMLYSGDLLHLKRVRSVNEVLSVPKFMTETVRVLATLRSSVTNIRKCAALFKSWRVGVGGLKVASKASRLAKGAMVGLAMVVDVYEIGSTANEMASGQKSEASMYLHTLTEELENQKKDISSYYLSLNS